MEQLIFVKYNNELIREGREYLREEVSLSG
jgi:hypothetical protein